MGCVVKTISLAWALGAVIEGCYASVFCENQDGVIIYSCEDTAYCCGTSECCLLDNATGFDFLTLWYFWAFVAFGLFIISTISGMFCKSKRHRDRVSVIDYPRAREAPDGQEDDGYRQQQQQPQSQQQQVLVIPVLYNQPPPMNDRPPPYSISGSVYPNNGVTMGTGIHPGMQRPQGPATRRSMMEPRPPGGRGSLRPRQTALPASGQFIKPLGPGYRPPGPAQYGPMPPGYVPTQ
ncbi:uncharacterized protein [Asterias amurensis]|uniref:uncharacterized protein n=1 Tax=Asterias amurensis TaxID=7602 RepID=UPI003AB5C8D2